MNLEDYALKLLAKKSLSISQLRERLFQDGFISIEIEKLVGCLQGDKVICDKRFAENYILSKSNQGFGKNRIYMELEYKGVNKADIDFAVEMLSINWDEVLQNVVINRNVLNNIDTKNITKKASFLVRRGFSIEEIESCLKYNNIYISMEKFYE